MHAIGSDQYKFARLYIAIVHGAKEIEGTCFRGEYNRVRQPVLAWNMPHCKRTKAAGIAGGEDLVAGCNHKRECAFDTAQRVGYRIRQSLLVRLSNQVQHDLGIARSLENRSGQLEAFANVGSIHQVAVVCNRDLTLVAIHLDWLRVQQRRISRRRVTSVANGMAPRQLLQHSFTKNIRH